MYEFVFDGFSKEQCEAYLKRIKASFDGNITLDNLNALIFQHQITVPFEDLAVYENWGTVNLEPEALFHKIVTEHRGGFCFELNGAFLLLLKDSGLMQLVLCAGWAFLLLGRSDVWITEA